MHQSNRGHHQLGWGWANRSDEKARRTGGGREIWRVSASAAKRFAFEGAAAGEEQRASERAMKGDGEWAGSVGSRG